MPIKDASGDVVGVAQVINKQGDLCFTANDEKVSITTSEYAISMYMDIGYISLRLYILFYNEVDLVTTVGEFMDIQPLQPFRNFHLH